MKRAFFFILLSFVSLAQASERLSEVKKLLERSVYSCPDRIWRGVDWRAARITLLSPSRAIGFTLQHGRTEAVSPKEASAFKSAFQLDQRGVTVNVDAAENSEDAFGLLVHEGFHAFGQSDMSHNTLGRSEIYPAPYEPRLEREELTRALIAHFNGEAGALEKAAGWHERHASHKEDLGSDVIEGSAEYVEKVALVIARHGCDVSEEKITRQVVDELASQGAAFDKEYEHYRIGALSFLLARPRLSQVLERMDDKKLVLDVLFQNVTPSRDLVADTLLDHAAEMTVNMSNRRSEDVLNPIRQHIKEGGQLVFVPFHKLSGSFVHAGAFIAEGVEYYQELSLTAAKQKLEGNGFKTQACGEAHGFMMLTADEVQGVASEKHQGASVICL